MKRFATVIYDNGGHMVTTTYMYDMDYNLLGCIGFENYAVSVGYRDTLMYAFLYEVEKMIKKHGFSVERIKVKCKYRKSLMEELEYFPIVKNNTKEIY